MVDSTDRPASYKQSYKLIFEDVDDFTLVYNRRTNTDVLPTLSINATDEKQVGVVDDKKWQVDSRIDCETVTTKVTNTVNSRTMNEFCQLDDFFTPSGSIKRKRSFSAQVEKDTLAQKFAMHLNNLHVMEERCNCQIGTSNDKHKWKIKNSNTEVNYGKLTATQVENDTLETLDGKDYYIPSLVIIESGSVGRHKEPMRSGSSQSGVDYEEKDEVSCKIDGAEIFDLKWPLNKETPDDLDFKTPIPQHDSERHSLDHLSSGESLETNSKQLETREALEEISNCTDKLSNVGGKKGKKVAKINCCNDVVDAVHLSKGGMGVDETVQKEANDLARVAYGWARDAFRFPKVKDYVASYEMR